jgi:Uma2 family endonuclease
MASALAKKRPATYADLLALPENVVGEIVDGELIVSPRPAPAHAIATSSLGGEIMRPFGRGRGGPGGWLIVDEPELHLGEQVLVPDLAGWLRERMPRLPETAWFELRPDWVCEVLSPSTAILDRTRKQEIYCNGNPGRVSKPSRALASASKARLRQRKRSPTGVRQNGVPWLWFVDPAARTIEVLKLSGQDLIVAGTFGGDGEMRVPPFDAVAIDVGALWDSPAPAPGGADQKG